MKQKGNKVYDRPRRLHIMRRLYKSNTDKKLAGVLGGIAEYFRVDSTLIRLIFVVALVFGVGTPLIVYVVAAFIMPNDWEVR